MRHLVWRLLKTYDRYHGTTFFKSLTVADITVHEEHISALLDELQIDPADQRRILTWYETHAWSSEATLEAHRPFGSVLEVIRWFQMQPNTTVGLNTGRPEYLRADTLRSLNKLGQEYKVFFPDELLYMRPNNWGDDVPQAKVAGVRYFQQMGYRIFAFVDNEPDNLQLISEIDPDHEILLLHADTIFNSKRTQLPPRAVGGKTYNLTALIPEEALPRHIQFVWHSINSLNDLNQFLISDIHWGEFDVRLDPTGHDLIVRQDSFDQTPFQPNETLLRIEYALARLKDTQKGVKLNFKVGSPVISKALRLVRAYGFRNTDLWFSGNVDDLHENGFQEIAHSYPRAIIQCQVDFLAPLVNSTPDKAKEILDIFRSWGINRFSINWQTPNLRPFFDQMDRWGFEVNIYNIPNLETFLQAIILMPRSITSNFDFPEWYYNVRDSERGSGEYGSSHDYFMQEVTVV
jgi:hypothetical protein